MSRVPPELINLENQMDAFFSEMRRQNESVETEAEAEQRFMECTERLKANHRDSDIFQVKQRSLVIGFLAGLIFWGALGLILWIVR